MRPDDLMLKSLPSLIQTRGALPVPQANRQLIIRTIDGQFLLGSYHTGTFFSGMLVSESKIHGWAYADELWARGR